MVVYIAFIASLNLCVGYALGVYFGVCPGISMGRDEEEDEVDNDEVLGLPMATPAPRAAVMREAMAVAPEATATPASDGANIATILAGLGDFKSKLENVSAKLSSVADDREAMDDCAGEMREANTEYLERTAEAIQSLGATGSTSQGTSDPMLRQKLHDHSDEVRRVNVEIDGLASESDLQKVRQMLMDSSDQLTQTTAVVEYTLEGEAESSQAAANRALGGIDSMIALIDQELANPVDDQPLVVAKLTMKPITGLVVGDAGDLLRGIASLVALELTNGQAMFTDPEGHIALTLAGDDEETASERCERIRQQVAGTTFRRGEEELMADLLCSIADTRKASRSNEVLGRLEAGLAKASGHGTGCTVYNNGDALTVVTVGEMSIEPQVVEL